MNNRTDLNHVLILDLFMQWLRFLVFLWCDTATQPSIFVPSSIWRSNNISYKKAFFHCVLQGLWKRFNSGKKAKTVVKDLFFGVERGEVFGLLGPNGAGKTTSLNMVTGDLPPTRGKVAYRYDYDIINNKT